MVAEFVINEDYITDVVERNSWNTYAKKENPTQEDLIAILQGKGWCSSTSNKDHPEFAKLREQLGELGYIKIERGWWNGDRVLKPFTLNGVGFKKGEQFASSAAMKHHLEFRRKHPEDEYEYE